MQQHVRPIRQEVVFLRADQDDPKTDEMNDICLEMAERGLVLSNAISCQGTGEDGSPQTVGLWLFFSDASTQIRSPDGPPVVEESYYTPPPRELPQRWSVNAR